MMEKKKKTEVRASSEESKITKKGKVTRITPSSLSKISEIFAIKQNKH